METSLDEQLWVRHPFVQLHKALKEKNIQEIKYFFIDANLAEMDHSAMSASAYKYKRIKKGWKDFILIHVSYQTLNANQHLIRCCSWAGMFLKILRVGSDHIDRTNRNNYLHNPFPFGVY